MASKADTVPSESTVPKRPTSLSTRNYPTWLPKSLHVWQTSYIAILIWYAFNMTLVLSGKFIFATIKPPPAALTCLHVTTGFLLSSLVIAVRGDAAKKNEAFAAKFDRIRECAPLAIFFALNIYLSNLCTQLSTNASFTATIKALTPVVTWVIYAIMKRQLSPTWHKQVAAIMVVISGVLLNASTDSQWDMLSLFVGIAATVACALMAIFQTKGLQTLDPMVVLNSQAPTVVLLLAIISYTTEMDSVQAWWANATWSSLGVVMAHGILAFLLNIVASACAAVTKPVQKTIFGNLKVAFIYFLECAMWSGCGALGVAQWCSDHKLKKELEHWTIAGCAIIFIGALWYGQLYEAEKNLAAKQKGL